MDQKHWLLKTEPDDFSWDDLVAESRSTWDGVRAPAALRHMTQLKPDDLALIYHTGRVRAVVGVARVMTHPYPDPTMSSERYLVVDVAPVARLPVPVTLSHIKERRRFPEWELVRLPRLSVVPVTPGQFRAVLDWGGLARLPAGS